MKLQAVLVTYKMHPSDSPALASLLQSQLLLPEADHEVHVLVWDNTPDITVVAAPPAGVRYISAPHNPGLSPAYNHALQIAKESGREWLLTLDQDTILPLDFLPKLARIIDCVNDDKVVAAILPQVIAGKRRISPFHFANGAIPRAIPEGFTGVSPYSTYGVNSSATLRISSLERIEGYNPLFPLDISDIDLFHRIARAGMSVYVEGSLSVAHDFSLLNKAGRMRPERYRSMLRDECAFWDMNMNGAGRAERMIRLAGRACKDLFRRDTLEFQRVTCGEMIRRLVTPRSRRVEEWNDWAQRRRLSAIRPHSEVSDSAGASQSASLP